MRRRYGPSFDSRRANAVKAVGVGSRQWIDELELGRETIGHYAKQRPIGEGQGKIIGTERREAQAGCVGKSKGC